MMVYTIRKLLILFSFSLLVLGCTKTRSAGPQKVQDIRGTKWISRTSVGTTYPGGSVYMKLMFTAGSDFYNGSGICTFQLKDGTLIGFSDMKWELNYGQDSKNKTEITVKYQDWDDKSQTMIGSWVIGTLSIDGVSYSKE